MDRQIWLIGALTWLFTVWLIMGLYKPKTSAYTRLFQLIQQTSGRSFIDDTKSFAERIIIPWMQALMPQSLSYNVIKQRISYAGRPGGLSPESFYLAKLGLLSMLPVAGVLVTAMQPFRTKLLAIVSIACIGFFLPDIWLSRKIRERHKAITSEIIDFVDLLAIACEAGMSLNDAVYRVIQEQKGIVSREWQRTFFEITAARPRTEALLDLADRNGTLELSQLVSAILQGERYGTPIAHTLRAQASQLRAFGKHKITEQAHKVGVKSLGAMMLMFIPFLALLLGPAVIALLKGF